MWGVSLETKGGKKIFADAGELLVEYDGKLVPPQACWSGGAPSGAESLFFGVLWSPGSLGSRSSVWGQAGSWAPTLSHGFVFLPARTIAFIVLFSQYLKDVPVPLPSYQRGKKCHFSPVYIFQIFPVCWNSQRHGDRGRGIGLTLPGLPGLFPLVSSRVSASQHSPLSKGAEGEKVPMALTMGREQRREGHQDPLSSICLHSMCRGKVWAGRHLVPHNCAGDLAIP